MVIKIITTDSTIWNKDDVLLELSYAMANNASSIVLDLINEGPCLNSMGLYRLLELYSAKFNYNLENIVVSTSNKLEYHPIINIKYNFPKHLMHNAWNEYRNITIKKNISKYFGIFIGKSNSQRLHISSYLNTLYKDQTVLSYRYDVTDDYYRDNIGLEDIIKRYNTASVEMESTFLKECPILLNNATKLQYIKNTPNNLSQQLDSTNNISNYYDNFFIEIVCESYFTGNTFFPTEKIWRPILLKTPFIVQGSQHYLKYLQSLGFKTFADWWDEGYDMDHINGKIQSLKQNIDWIGSQSKQTITDWYNEMQPILEYNYNRLQELINE